MLYKRNNWLYFLISFWFLSIWLAKRLVTAQWELWSEFSLHYHVSLTNLVAVTYNWQDRFVYQECAASYIDMHWAAMPISASWLLLKVECLLFHPRFCIEGGGLWPEWNLFRKGIDGTFELQILWPMLPALIKHSFALLAIKNKKH